jgi:hypothetical protein
LAFEARPRALVSGGQADSLYREVIDRLGRTRLRVDLARAHLLYGEWLRRQGRICEARDQLRGAHQIFDYIAAEAFAERARIELRVTGERARRKRWVETHDALTAQEALIAHLARPCGGLPLLSQRRRAEGASKPRPRACSTVSARWCVPSLA